jgi:hypothetical protein
MGALIQWWWIVAIAVLALVSIAFTQCAVAELVARLAVRLQLPPGQRRDDRLEECLDTMQALEPRERPAHAGSLLWVGTRSGVARGATGLLRRRRPAQRSGASPSARSEDRITFYIGHRDMSGDVFRYQIKTVDGLTSTYQLHGAVVHGDRGSTDLAGWILENSDDPPEVG